MEYTAVIDNKKINAKSFTQLKRKASIEANKKSRAFDEFYLISAPGFKPMRFTRFNKKFPNGEIIRGELG